jgi:hypothetical protein
MPLPTPLAPRRSRAKWSTPRPDAGRGKPKSGKRDQDQTTPEPWWSSNPSTVAAWLLPEGKNYNDFFTPREPEKKPNTLG